MSDEQLMTGIGAVLSSYIYKNFTTAEDKDISIGQIPNEFFFHRNMSKPDLYFFATKKNESQKRKVYVVFRGTNSYEEARETWPIIATSTENLKRNWWSNYFNDRLRYVNETLGLFNETKENLELYFSGHSLGGSMARVAANNFYDTGHETKAFAFNPGHGLLSNSFIFKMAEDFLKKHTDSLIVVYTPDYTHEGLKMLKDNVMESVLGNWLNSTKFKPPHTKQYVTAGDPVSALGLNMDTSFFKNEQGDYWNFLSNHDMENLKKQVLTEINLHDLILKHHANPIENSKLPIHDVLTFQLHREKLKVPQNVEVDPLQLHDIDNFQPFITLSRINFLNDVNKFNFL